MKVLHILPENEPFSPYHGGAISRWVGSVLPYLQNEVALVPSTDGGWEGAESIVSPELAGLASWAKRLRPIRWHGRSREALARRYLAPVVKGIGADLVYVHNRPDMAMGLLGAVGSSKVVLHLQNSHLAGAKGRHIARFKDGFAGISACSQFVIDEVPGLTSSGLPTQAIPNGADPDLFQPLPDDRKAALPLTVLFVGRLVEVKGIQVLLEAMAKLWNTGSNAKLRIVGAVGFGDGQETPYVESLRQTATKYQQHIEFAGYRSGKDLADDFAQASVFCCPSTWNEAFGMVNVEAMAAGTPVVAAAVGGIPEILATGGGKLFPRGDATALATILGELLANDTERITLGREAREVVLQRFTWDQVATVYGEFRDRTLG